jgi:hypothetical protein
MRQKNRSDLAHPEPSDATWHNALEIARTQLARRRRGLGSLTPQQETAIEDLLVRTVDKVSKLAVQILESWPAVP